MHSSNLLPSLRLLYEKCPKPCHANLIQEAKLDNKENSSKQELEMLKPIQLSMDEFYFLFGTSVKHLDLMC